MSICINKKENPPRCTPRTVRNRIIMILISLPKKNEEKEKGEREFNEVYCLDKKGGRMYDSKPHHLFSPTNNIIISSLL